MAFKAGAVVGEAVLKTAKWTSGVGVIQKSAKAVGGALVTMAKVGFVATAAAIVKVTHEANKFQKAFSNVTTLVDASSENFQDISLSLLKLDSSLGSTLELTEGVYQALSAGAEDSAQAIEIVTEAAIFSTAALTDNATAVDVLTTAMNAYGSEVVSAEKASDIFFTTVEKGKITGAELSGVIGQSIPLFASSGIAIEELSAGIAAMTKQGVKASETTTQMNAIVNSFIKPSQALTDSLQDLGFESGAAFLKAEGLAGALKLLEKETKGDAAALGEMLPNIRALRGAMALTGRGGKEFTTILKDMENSAGSARTAFEKQEKTFKTLKNETGKTQIILGNISKFFVDDLAKAVTESTTAFNNFLLSAEGMNLFADVMAKISGAASVVREIFKIIGETVGPVLKQSIDDIKAEFDEMFGSTVKNIDGMEIFGKTVMVGVQILKFIARGLKVVGMNILNLTNIIIEAGGVIGSFWDLIRGRGSFDEVKKQIGDVGEGFKKFGKGFVENVGELVLDTVDDFKTFGDEAGETAKRMENAYTTAFKKTEANAKKTYKTMITGTQKTGEVVEDTAQLSEDRWSAAMNNIIEDDAPTKLQQAWSEFEAWSANNLKSIGDKFKFAFDAIMQGVSTLFSGISSISAQHFANENAKLENKFGEDQEIIENGYNAEVQALRDKLDANLITESEFNESKEVLDSKFAADQTALEKKKLDEQNKLNKKQFENEKALSIAQIWIDFASAVMGFWAAYAGIPFAGPIIAGTLTGAAGTIAAVQTGLVASQQFVPAREQGGMASGVTRINESGGEIVTLPDGSQVIPNDISRQIADASGSAGNKINVSFAGAKISDDLSLEKITRHVATALGRQLKYS